MKKPEVQNHPAAQKDRRDRTLFVWSDKNYLKNPYTLLFSLRQMNRLFQMAM